MLPITVQEPSGRDEIVRELRALHEKSRTFWGDFSTPAFFAPLGEAWSPADNVRHLLKSNRPVARAFAMPRTILLFRFGPIWRASDSYSGLRQRYRDRLARGASAGRFGPSPLDPAEMTEETRASLMADFDAVARDLAAAASRWKEWQLDRIKLPHPALGSLTAREMLFFTIFHNLHHIENVVRRQQAA